jgi:fatty-acyl-CoA synthase
MQVQALAELSEALPVLQRLRTPYLRLRASDTEGAPEAAAEFLAEALPEAEQSGIVLLVETAGAFSDTSLLRKVLSRFAVISSVLYGICTIPSSKTESPPRIPFAISVPMYAMFTSRTAPATGNTALSVKERCRCRRLSMHLRFCQLQRFNRAGMGPEMVGRIRRNGFDLHALCQLYVPAMKIFPAHARVCITAGMGKAAFSGKRTVLIEKTFSQVLDSMAEEFPDQYAIRYTTLDHTRTYAAVQRRRGFICACAD